MFGKSTFTKILEDWAEHGGDLNGMLGPRHNRRIKDHAEATAICAALGALREDPSLVSQDAIGSALHTLAGFFQSARGKEVVEVFFKDGLPQLRSWVHDVLEGKEVRVDDVMFILKILAMYRRRDDVDLIAAAARKPFNKDGYMWSVIFGQFDEEHPFSLQMIDALRDPLPSDFILVTYLDMANRLAIAGRLDGHPFNSQKGREQLEFWLRDTVVSNYSFAHSATAAMPFVDTDARAILLELAVSHPDPTVRAESAWAQAKTGDNEGVRRLVELCLDLRYSQSAQSYLEELGLNESIPKACGEPEFEALAEMANWLAHPNEYGRAPERMSLYDSRTLFWPPKKQRLQAYLVKYEYSNPEGGEPDRGVGMVGSITFSLFGDAIVDMPAEDIYALHCCWELEMIRDADEPKERTVEAGREILRRHNEGF